MGWARTSAIVAATVAVSAYSLACALAAVAESDQPGMDNLPFASGFAQADNAAILVAASSDPKHPDRLLPDAPARRRIAELSRRAYAQEPLASLALRNLGLLADSAGDVARARLLMNDATRLTRRDVSVNSWLMLDYARRKDFAGVLRSYDVALRSSADARERMLPPLVDALASPQLVGPLIKLLHGNPPWEDDFWAEAFRHGPALDNLAEIRIARAHDGYAGDIPRDRSLLKALVDARKFASAERLYAALAATAPADGEVVHDPGFDRASVYPPLDWQLFFGDSLSADLLAGAAALRIGAFDNGQGQVARQLVALPGDDYTFAVKVLHWEPRDQGSLYAKITCAEAAEDGQPAVRLAITKPDFSAPFRKPSAGCTYHWLDLFAQTPGDGQDMTVDVDSISIRARR